MKILIKVFERSGRAVVCTTMPRRKFNAHVKRAVAARGGWKCADCNTLLDETYELDHVIALHLGGPDTVENLAALHADCHRKKTLREEIARLERLAHSKRVCTLVCGRCEHVVSPYFVHKCCTTISSSPRHPPNDGPSYQMS